ncbi:MAG: xanthine dehydrogenase family protein subunit M [Candidatus Eisenbacteria bacterium]
MIEFEPVVAGSLEECLEALAKYGSDAALLAGGTDLYVLMETGMKLPKAVIHISGVEDLKVSKVENGCVAIGAAVTHSEIARLEVMEGVDCLRAGASAVGSPQIRNVGTAGGNIANGSPAADLYPPLMVLDAVLELRSLRGAREVAVEEFVMGPGITSRRSDELITGARFSRPEGRFYSGFAKIGLRDALAISVANAAVTATCKDGKFDQVRIACGAVAPRPIRMKEVEALLTGQEPSAELIRQAGDMTSRQCDPITDIRASRDYRRHVAGVIVSRLIENASGELMMYGKEGATDA